jgi:16S rRNA (guanine966-N2)-methyltransferase
MRVIGGSRAGRRINAPPGQATRPTSDRVREAIFNRLQHGAFASEGVDADPFASAVLDLYAGAGGLGLEALSRGAPRCDFVDSSAAACAVIRSNLESLALAGEGAVHACSVEAFLRRAHGPYGLVFADPPYADADERLGRVLARLAEPGLLLPQALVVVEHGDKSAPAPSAAADAGLALLDRRRYGQTVVSFFVGAAPARGI